MDVKQLLDSIHFDFSVDSFETIKLSDSDLSTKLLSSPLSLYSGSDRSTDSNIFNASSELFEQSSQFTLGSVLEDTTLTSTENTISDDNKTYYEVHENQNSSSDLEVLLNINNRKN